MTKLRKSHSILKNSIGQVRRGDFTEKLSDVDEIYDKISSILRSLWKQK